MMTIYAKCPDGVDCGYLTPGKLYEVISGDGRLFSIKDDDGDCIRPSWNSSSHIEGKNWERIEWTIGSSEKMSFPEKFYEWMESTSLSEGGSTLRDQFAMAALAAVEESITSPYDAAKWAYDVADAMIEVRDA